LEFVSTVPRLVFAVFSTAAPAAAAALDAAGALDAAAEAALDALVAGVDELLLHAAASTPIPRIPAAAHVGLRITFSDHLVARCYL
jgi:hypothetical protein